MGQLAVVKQGAVHTYLSQLQLIPDLSDLLNLVLIEYQD